eukprot:PhF_6_TR37216/c0_g1_i1/m.54878
MSKRRSTTIVEDSPFGTEDAARVDKYTTLNPRYVPPSDAGNGLSLIDGVIHSTLNDDDSDDENAARRKAVQSRQVYEEKDIEVLHGQWNQIPFRMPRAPLPEDGDRKYYPPSLSNAVVAAYTKENLLVVFGGSTDSIPSNETWLYNLGTKFWSQVPVEGAEVVPGPRSGHCGCSLRDIEVPIWKRDVERIAEAQRMKQAIPSDIQRTQYNPQMWVFGGADVLQRKYYNDTWVFEVTTKKWRKVNAGGAIPSPRWMASCGVVELRVYVFGGESPDYSLLGDLHVYDHHQEMWTPIRAPTVSPPPRTMHACAVVRDKLILCGGIGATVLTDTWVLETRSLNWVKIDDGQGPFSTADGKVSGIHGHAMVACNEFVFLHGGKVNGKFSAKAWIMDTRTNQWYSLDPPTTTASTQTSAPIARWRHGICTLREVNATKTMDLFLSLDEMQEQGHHLTDEREMKTFITELRSEVVHQRLFKGMRMSYYEKPYVSNTVGILVFGGVGFARVFNDIWKYAIPTLHNDSKEGAAEGESATLLNFQEIEASANDDGSGTNKKKKSKKKDNVMS